MKHLSIIVPEGELILDTVVGTYNLFKMANSYSKLLGKTKEDVFYIDLVGLTHNPVACHEYFIINPSKTIKEIERTDLIIISSITGNIENAIAKNRDFIDFIREMRVKYSSELASLCRSAFILAETGFLNEKSCTTHWAVHDQFKEKYPQINLLPSKIICEEKGIYSSGGAYSFFNLIIYLIERYYGREVAIRCSKMAEIDLGRDNQSMYAIFNGQKEHKDEVIKTIQGYLEVNYEEKINVADLAKRFLMSSRNLSRRFKKATKNTLSEYTRRVRVEVAKKNLESSQLNINEVMYSVGYNDEKTFRKTFKKHTGLSPKEYRKKYNRNIA